MKHMKQTETSLVEEQSRAHLQAWLTLVGAGDAFAALADSIPNAAVYAVDAQRNVVYWNDNAEALLGFTRADVVGNHCLKASRCTQCMAGCGIYDHGQIKGVPLELYRQDGSTVRVRKWGRAFLSESGGFLGGVEVLLPEEQSTASLPALLTLPDRDGDIENFHGLISRDPAMREVSRLVRNIAQTDVPVLIRGESGTGKELVASAIHVESNRKSAPFLAINCAAVAPALLESELFGHAKGAFTGAIREHQGLFERANGGTLFLDEVAELPLELQAKLLRVLQEMTFFRLGGTEPITVDVRIVSATHRSLRAEVAAGRFRADLMYRLRVVPVFLPALRERRNDIPVLLNHFLAQLNARGPRKITRIVPEAMRLLLDYPWPGNIRELKNVLEYAFAVGYSTELRVEDLPPEFRQPVAPPLPAVSEPTEPIDEREAIERALQAHGGHVGKAAESLGMSRPTFWRKRKALAER